MKNVVGLLAGMVACQAVHGAISNTELQDALGNVAGVTWSVNDPAGTAWARTYDSYDLRPPGYRLVLRGTPGAGLSYSLSGQVQGPGILELDRAASANLPTTLKVDGGTDGGIVPDRDHTDRVYVPAGSHEVTWTLTPGNTWPYAATTFGRARWQPGEVLPLSAGEADGSVVLGGADWQGLAGWPDGDGSVAWSGLVHAAAGTAAAKILRGDMADAGVVRFRYLARGKEARVRTDGGQWTDLPFKDQWSTGFVSLSGNGPHSIEWEASGLVDARRVPTDLALNDVKRVAEVNFATALDCPELTFAETPLNIARPLGVEMDGARGGAGVVVNHRSGLDLILTETSLVKIRETGGGTFFGGGALSNPWARSFQSDVLSTETRPDGEWVTRCYRLGPGTYTLGSHAEARVDYLEIVPQPALLSEVLGLPEGSFTTGGDTPWIIQPQSSSGKYEASLSITDGLNEGWIEHEVTGPAEIAVNSTSRNYDDSLRVLVDGNVCWDSSIPYRGDSTRTSLVEVPEGRHLVRYHARRISPNAGTWLTIGGITVTPLPPGGKISALLDMAMPSGRIGTWEQKLDPGYEGGGALRAVSAWAEYGEKPVLRVPFTGPGMLRYRTWFNGMSSYSYLAMLPSFATGFSRYPGTGSSGWVDHELWVPPGSHWMDWAPKGTAEEVSVMLIDRLSYVPDQLVTVEEALGTEGLAWDSVPAGEPWQGVLKSGGADPVAVSPMATPYQSKRLSLQVTGPGLVSFKWKRGGAVTGAFYLDGVKAGPALLGNPEEEESLFISNNGTSLLEWEASTREGKGWLEVKQFQWEPWTEHPLNESLDAGGLAWTTSPHHPVVGRSTPGAVGGTAANALVTDGESTWLETTVEGAGMLNFSVLASSATGGANPWSIGIGMRITVDGRVVQDVYGRVKPVLVMGDGPHKIRIEIDGYWGGPTIKAVAVDNVSWLPREETDPGEGWSSSVPEAIAAFPSIGENGADGIILLTTPGEERWIEREVTGPGRLSWRENRSVGEGTSSHWNSWVDGVMMGIPYGLFGDWDTYVMDVPAGKHRVRFSLTPEVAELNPDLVTPPAWIISGMTFTPGTTLLMEGLDHDGAVWVANGPDAGHYVPAVDAYDQEDKWVPGTRSALYLINPGANWIQTSGDINGSAGEPPLRRSSFVAPESFVIWNDSMDDREVLLVDRFRSQPLGETSLAVALDHAGAVEAAGWYGFSFPDDDGQDFSEDGAVSSAPRDDRAGMSTVVQGPAKVRFRWKCDARTRLIAGIDGRETPLAPAGTEWTQAELDVEPGTHVISWHHLSLGNFSFDPSVALVDALEVEPLSIKTPGEVVTLAGTPVLPVEVGSGWSIKYRQKPDGSDEALGTDSSDGMLKLTVEGPRILSFRSWMSQRPPLISGEPPAVPDWAQNIWEYVLEVKTGDELLREVPLFHHDNLSEILLPAGTHEISWRLMAKRYDPVTWEGTAVPVWQDFNSVISIRDLHTISPEDHFQQWKTTHGLTGEMSGPNDDADGDGMTNFMEYAYGFDPREASSRTPGLWTWTSTEDPIEEGAPPGARNFIVAVDHTLPHVESVLEESRDLVTWDKVMDTASPKINNGMLAEVLTYPLIPESPARFFRLRMVVPGAR